MILARLAALESGTGGNPGANYSYNEVPTPAPDGATLAFTLAHTPSPAGSLIVAVNDAIAIPGVDYNLAGAIITFTAGNAPKVGETIRALQYRY